MPLINGGLSEHFGQSQALAFVDVNDATREVMNIDIVPLKHHACGLIPSLIHQRNAKAVVLVGIGGRPLMMLQEAGVEVFVGKPGAAPYDLAHAWAEGRLCADYQPCNHHEGEDHVCHGEHGEHHG